ncbi:DUF805 domain-containing protein [Psychrobacter jeotgali]|uniref:DUF805 domain-containing protein n=1 Tax=Psychrobacter jeotgali TaxID=179010 RepID=UPI00191B8708|nr:DUF805 domain-containing protein [Psychrobacter jeotgali]
MIDPRENKTTLDKVYQPPSTNPTIDNNDIYAAEENYSIIDWFKKSLRNYTNFSGRARRKEYWYFVLVHTVLMFITSMIDAMLFDSGFPLFYGIVALGLFVPGLAVTIRRLHDTSRSGWWVLLSLIPLIGSIVLLIFFVSQTKFETNQWGPPAK